MPINGPVDWQKKKKKTQKKNKQTKSYNNCGMEFFSMPYIYTNLTD